MQLGMVGLGRMGGNIVRRLMRDGHDCVAFDLNPEAVAALATEGATGAASLEAFVGALQKPRAVWLMLPAGVITEQAIEQLTPLLSSGDVIIDGGNTHYVDDLRRAETLAPKGIHYADVGVEAAARTGGRTGAATPAEQGYLRCGPVGSGHFVKMVHNGIEYGLMASFAEGLNILANADAGMLERDADAETAPLEHPERYRYPIDVAEVAEVWRRGSVVQSWLLDLTAAALAVSPGLDGFAGRVSDSGEGRWTAIAAIEEGVPAVVLTAALSSRFASRGNADFANKILSAMRSEFGGHAEKATGS